MDVGTYTVTATYGGDAKYLKSSVSTVVKVNKPIPEIQVTANTIVYGDDLIVEVQLPCDVTRRVSLTIENETKMVSLKNGTGSARFSGLTGGTHIITASYDGDAYYLNSSINTTVKVNRSVPEIQVTANDITYGETLTIGVQIPPDVTRRVVMYIDDQMRYVSIKDGIGSVQINGLSVGKYDITVSYAGDTNYLKASFATSIEVTN